MKQSNLTPDDGGQNTREDGDCSLRAELDDPTELTPEVLASIGLEASGDRMFQGLGILATKSICIRGTYYVCDKERRYCDANVRTAGELRRFVLRAAKVRCMVIERTAELMRTLERSLSPVDSIFTICWRRIRNAFSAKPEVSRPVLDLEHLKKLIPEIPSDSN